MSAVLLSRGDVGPEVTEVRHRLYRLGLIAECSVEAQEIFDDELMRALMLFQQSRGLNVDGIVGPQTRHRLEEARWKIGDRVLNFVPRKMIHGEDVAQLQQRLIELGFVINRVDGVYGPQTENAVKEFQRSVGLANDGICGPDVFSALDRLNRTVAGGSQEHLRELATWDPVHRPRSVETCTILLDPSHDQTVLVDSDGLTQAEVCWDIANRLEGRLAAAGALVVMTRSRNSTSSAERDRAELANLQNVHLVLSITMDNQDNSQAHGVATYYFGHAYSRSATGLRFAEIIQEELCAGTSLCDMRTHAKTWDLVRLTRMPCVQTAIGYSSNHHDSALLQDPSTRDKIADALNHAISRILAPRIG